MNVPQILAVYDDVEIRVLLSRYILEPGFRVQLASRCSKVGGGRIDTNSIDLIVLYVMLPAGSGFDVRRDQRIMKLNTPASDAIFRIKYPVV
jgi:two-component system phosphate regulon response regulator OmpR